jgi:hypothetical protein
MGKPESVQINRGVDNVAQRKDVRRFGQNAGLSCPHRTRNDKQRFRKRSTTVQSCHLFGAGAMG